MTCRRPMCSVQAAFLVAALVVLGSCNRGGDDTVTPAGGTNPPTTGATCDDEAGDLSSEAGERHGTLREPAGVDLVHAEARVTDTALRVSFVTAGPIPGTPSPEFFLAQGPPGQLDSFELVAAPGAADAWELQLVTFQQGDDAEVAEAPPRVLSTPVHVDGTTLSYEVPLRDVPRIATYVWLFGTSSIAPAGDDTVIDDCERYGSGDPGAVATTSTMA